MEQAVQGNQMVRAMVAGRRMRRNSNQQNGMLRNRRARNAEQMMSNLPEEIHATNDDDDDYDDDSSIWPSNRNTRRRAVPSDDQDDDDNPPPRKRLQRLTPQQIQLLEGFFSICAHPDDSQKKQLSETTGMALLQVKFWFQNKRTQVKNRDLREENYRLKVENEMLRDENRKFKQAQRTTYCPTCADSPAQNKLIAEMERVKQQNGWLQKEIARLHAEAHPSANLSLQLDSSMENAVVRQDDTEMIAELAKNAMHELVILAESNGPLWLPVPGGALDILNKMAYAQTFGGRNIANITGFKTEATRADAVIMMDIKNIVDYLMDSECYESFFPGVLSGAKTIKVYKWPNGEGCDGAMQLMTIQSVFPSPLVPSRKCTFVRYCKELREGIMAVVDVSLEDGDGTLFKCRKMPSGVLIKSIRPNSCKVTVIEHVQVDDTGIHELYQPCLSGLMFGARRWMTSMAQQCARIRDIFHVTRSSLSVSSKGRKTLMKLADDLLVSYAGSIASTPDDGWTVLRGAGTADDIKVAYRRHEDGTNNAIVSVSASFRLPLSLRVTFGLLRNHMLRPKWDVLVNGGTVKEEVRVSNGVGPNDAVSVVHVKQTAESRDNIMILQNSCYDVAGSFMVYSPIDNKLMNKIMSPGDSSESKVALFPTGFSLLPNSEAAQGGAGLGEDGGTLVTVGFQILLKLARGTGLYPKSVSAAINLMSDNIDTIKTTLTNSHPIFRKRSQPSDGI